MCCFTHPPHLQRLLKIYQPPYLQTVEDAPVSAPVPANATATKSSPFIIKIEELRVDAPGLSSKNIQLQESIPGCFLPTKIQLCPDKKTTTPTSSTPTRKNFHLRDLQKYILYVWGQC